MAGIILTGCNGKMGRAVTNSVAETDSFEIVCGIDIFTEERYGYPVYASPSLISDETAKKADVIIDFSNPGAIAGLLEFAVKHSLPAVICTTGLNESQINLIRTAATKIPVFFSANMSLGVALLVELAKTAALAMPDAEIEIIEKHHNRKLDAPSGTALMISSAIKEVRPTAYENLGRSGQGKRCPDEIGIHAIRMGNIVGEHEVIIGTQTQTITLKHEAHSRTLFAEGAIAAAAFLVTRPHGLYDMKSLVGG